MSWLIRWPALIPIFAYRPYQVDAGCRNGVAASRDWTASVVAVRGRAELPSLGGSATRDPVIVVMVAVRGRASLGGSATREPAMVDERRRPASPSSPRVKVRGRASRGGAATRDP